ncbi:MAG TPA: transcription antitermination factor NusB [Acidimicrobiia bacterium]|jgi:N utilization substance protein B|nr:transcription antitermination factor NusB [Acidimicrobiia bacterium]
MSQSEEVRIIPARLTVAGLADLIARDPTEVEMVLRARGEPAAPDDILGADVAIAAARALGVVVTVEPRDLALEQMYELETRGELTSDIGGRAGAIVDGVISDLDELDSLIESVSEHWSVARMPVIDRNIIRIGLHELRHDETTPTSVVISEAVRLAHTYSTEKSAGFVNGVLATLAKTIRDG